MRIPIQSMPVNNQLSRNVNDGVNVSGLACTLCKTACDALAPTPKALCIAGCNATVC